MGLNEVVVSSSSSGAVATIIAPTHLHFRHLHYSKILIQNSIDDDVKVVT
jgi:hypothetical protein